LHPRGEGRSRCRLDGSPGRPGPFARVAKRASVPHARREAELMARVVVIASSEVSRESLEAFVDPEDELHVVVPAVEQSRLQWLANDEDEARSEAENVGREIGDAAPTDPSTVTVKRDDPAQLVQDAIAEHGPDSIVIALRDGE